jgi:hypothetical protein
MLTFSFRQQNYGGYPPQGQPAYGYNQAPPQPQYGYSQVRLPTWNLSDTNIDSCSLRRSNMADTTASPQINPNTVDLVRRFFWVCDSTANGCSTQECQLQTRMPMLTAIITPLHPRHQE